MHRSCAGSWIDWDKKPVHYRWTTTLLRQLGRHYFLLISMRKSYTKNYKTFVRFLKKTLSRCSSRSTNLWLGYTAILYYVRIITDPKNHREHMCKKLHIEKVHKPTSKRRSSSRLRCSGEVSCFRSKCKTHRNGWWSFYRICRWWWRNHT